MPKKVLLFILIIFSFFIGFPLLSFANNLQITNVSLTRLSSTSDTVSIRFDIAWDNSWRTFVNRDAVWVFAKFKISGDSTWYHAKITAAYYNGSGTSLTIDTVSDYTGCFLYRSAEGYGSVDTNNIELTWQWGAGGNLLTSSATIDEINVYGIEMVYIPQGAFYIGDGDGTNESLSSFHSGTGNSAVYISSSLASDIRVDSNSYDDSQIENTGIGIDGDGGIDTDDDGYIDNASFPTGYNAFYVMKYEVTEGQWIDFFNTLTDAEKTTRDITSATGKNSDSTVARNTVSWASGDATTTREDRACSYIAWTDLCAYADWAGLRPMTELEFEKLARGGANIVYAEYAWGSTSITQAKTISGTGPENGTETITNSGANACYGNYAFSGGDSAVAGSGSGPLRSGIFAKSDSTRITSGASYYGVMELSGNLVEYAVTVGNNTGRAFQGTNGDGSLTTAGNATNSDWPGYVNSGTGVSSYGGDGMRTLSWLAAASNQIISDRSWAAYGSNTRAGTTGARFARTAP